MTSLSLFDQPRFRRSDPQTSRDAAQRMTSSARSLEAQILEILQFRALTADSVCKALGIGVRRWPSVKTCLSRLRKQGKLVWTGDVIGGQNLWTRPENTRVSLVVLADEVL